MKYTRCPKCNTSFYLRQEYSKLLRTEVFSCEECGYEEIVP